MNLIVSDYCMECRGCEFVGWWMFSGLVVEARQLLLQAEEALNLSIKAERRITDIEATFEGVANDISQTRANVAEATDILASAENKCMTMLLFLNLSV